MTSRLLFGLLLAGGIAAPQSTQSANVFEVVSIKPHAEPITFSHDPFIHGNTVTATAVTLLDLVTSAYGFRYDQVSGGPPWAASEHYDLIAKAAGEATLTNEQSGQMLQRLLADRFNLKVKTETREVAMYALVVGKGGPRFKPSAPDAPRTGFVRGSGGSLHMETSRGTMEQLANQLSFTAGRPVLDKTGFAGYFAYTLDWTPANRIPDPDSDVPSMVAALQEQLGLKLESTKGPINLLVIEAAEKPAAN